MKAKDKERILVEVVQRTLDHWTADPATTEEALFGTIYQERQRLENERNRKKARKEGSFYNDIYHEALQASPGRQRELLKKIIQFFSNEVVGHFDPRVYALATRIIPPSLNLLLNTVSPLRLLETLQGSNSLMDQLVIEGETDAIKKVAKLGTRSMMPR